MTHQINVDGTDITVESGANLLDTILKKKIPLDNACRSGSCHRCIIKCIKGNIPQTSQASIKSTLASQGYLLACQCIISSDMSFSKSENNSLRQQTKVINIEKKSEEFMILTLSIPNEFSFEAGQSLIVWKNKDDGRNYSIASIPSDGFIELHIKHYPKGCLTSWLFNEVQKKDFMPLQGPSGNCFYSPAEMPLLFIGNGTGLSPLIGIIRSALMHKHSKPIHLIHYVREKSQLYYLDELRKLQKEYDCFNFKTMVENDPSHKKLIDMASLEIKKNNQKTIYLAGSEGLVNQLRKQLFIHGASLNNMFSDVFSPHRS